MNRILVVEHEETIAALLRDGLTASGCTVEVVGGDAAVDRVLGGAFDVIIIDIGLPGDAALDVVRALREVDVSASVLVVARREVVRKALGSG